MASITCDLEKEVLIPACCTWPDTTKRWDFPIFIEFVAARGATYWLAVTEDAEFVRGGRWLSTRVLEIYLQEASLCTYADETVKNLCNIYPSVLEQAIFFKETLLPEAILPQLW